MPLERFIYLGDTARLPYGTKSAGTVQKYAVQAARALVDRGVKALVIACNTASAVALDALRDAYSPLPVFGVVDPGAEAACRVSRRGRIAVIGTEGTVRGGAYQRAILSRRADARVLARPCPLLVTLAEEGWVSGDVPERVVEAYLGEWLREESHPDCLLLGCTHFPILAPVIQRVGGPGADAGRLRGDHRGSGCADAGCLRTRANDAATAQRADICWRPTVANVSRASVGTSWVKR